MSETFHSPEGGKISQGVSPVDELPEGGGGTTREIQQGVHVTDPIEDLDFILEFLPGQAQVLSRQQELKGPERLLHKGVRHPQSGSGVESVAGKELERQVHCSSLHQVANVENAFQQTAKLFFRCPCHTIESRGGFAGRSPWRRGCQYVRELLNAKEGQRPGKAEH